MPTLSDLEAQVMQLSRAARAKLATHLLDSLPSPLHDSDEGVAEAMLRDAEMDHDPKSGMTLAKFKHFRREAQLALKRR